MNVQSIIFDERSIQISYFQEEERDQMGMTIHTDVIPNELTMTDLKTEITELLEAIQGLVNEWRALRRQVPVPRKEV